MQFLSVRLFVCVCVCVCVCVFLCLCVYARALKQCFDNDEGTQTDSYFKLCGQETFSCEQSVVGG